MYEMCFEEFAGKNRFLYFLTGSVYFSDFWFCF